MSGFLEAVKGVALRIADAIVRALGGTSMVKYIIRRVLAGIPVLLAITFAAFALIRAVPGGPFDFVGTKQRDERAVAALEQQFGLDKPLLIQFFNYVVNLLRGNFGPSLSRTNLGTPVSEIIAMKLPISMQVGIMAVMLGFGLGIPLGVLAAVYHNSLIDYTATFFAVLGRSIPSIVLGPVLILIFAVKLQWLPVAFWGSEPGVWIPPLNVLFSWRYISHAIMPVFTLGTGMSAGIARLTRASLLQVMRDDYIRTARAKGLPERTVIYLHALKNALIPVATIVGPLLAAVLTGTFVIELIFAIPGLGDTFVKSVSERDYNLLVGVTILYSAFLILGNILVDIMYTWLDPRIRYD